MISKVEIEKGQAVYTPTMLKIYNFLVVNFSNRFIWRCPKEKLIKLHQNNITTDHCDIGVGTGYYLNLCK